MTVSVRSATIPPLMGFDPNTLYTDVDGAFPFKPGQKVQTNDGNIYRFSYTTSSLTNGLAYMLANDGTFATGAGVTTTLSDAKTQNLGVPHMGIDAPTTLNSAATKTYFWMQTGGNFPVISCAAAVADGAYVNTTASAGVLDDAATNVVLNAVFVGAQSVAGGGTTKMYSASELLVDQA